MPTRRRSRKTHKKLTESPRLLRELAALRLAVQILGAVLHGEIWTLDHRPFGPEEDAIAFAKTALEPAARMSPCLRSVVRSLDIDRPVRRWLDPKAVRRDAVQLRWRMARLARTETGGRRRG